MQDWPSSRVSLPEFPDDIPGNSDKEEKTMKKLTVLVVTLMLAWGMGFSQENRARGDKGRGPEMMRHMNHGLQMVEMNLYPPRMILRVADKIGLSETQVAQIRKMDRNHQEWMVKSTAESRIRGIKLKALFDSEKVDRKALEKAVRSVSDSWTEIRLARINHLLDVRDLLTPEQIKKIDEGKHDVRKRMWRRNKRMNSRMGDRPVRRRD